MRSFQRTLEKLEKLDAQVQRVNGVPDNDELIREIMKLNKE